MSNLQKEKFQQDQRRKNNTDFVFIKAEETQPFFMKETIRKKVYLQVSDLCAMS